MGDSDDGIITRSLMYLFEQLGSTGGTGRGGDGCCYSLRASFAEIYNEQIFDLVRFDKKQLQVGSCCCRGWCDCQMRCAAVCGGATAVRLGACLLLAAGVMACPLAGLARRHLAALTHGCHLPAACLLLLCPECRFGGTPARASTCQTCCARSVPRWKTPCGCAAAGLGCLGWAATKPRHLAATAPPSSSRWQQPCCCAPTRHPQMLSLPALLLPSVCHC